MKPDAPTPLNSRFRQAVPWLLPPVSVVLAMTALHLGWIPRGVPGEWTWTSPIHGLSVRELTFATITIIGYLLYLLIASRLLSQQKAKSLVVFSLFPVAAATQVGLLLAAPYGYGLAKWTICSYVPACSGYFTVAANEAADLSAFLAKYPEWIKTQDALHIGTHPPGLIVEAKLWLNFWNARPEAARSFVSAMPGEFREAARNVAGKEGISAIDLASVLSISLTHWLACSLTVWPLYLLVRKLGYDPATGFSVAALWPVMPSVVMFQPASDVAFAPMATLAIALAVNSDKNPEARYCRLSLVICGLLLAFGMFFSLVFLGVGLIVALLVSLNRNILMRLKLTRILLIGVGFIAGTLLWGGLTHSNPLAIWHANQFNHARFYVEFPRTYTKWLLADVGELAFGLGLPLFAGLVTLAITSIRKPLSLKQINFTPGVITAWVLFFLAVSGRSLSEVGRLWIPFFPVLLSPLAGFFNGLRLPMLLPWTTSWIMLQVVWLQSLLQLVYPI